MDKMRVLVVDHEHAARTRLLDLLAKQQDVEVIGVSGNGSEALQQILGNAPDLLFLSVQMPNLDGFGVVRKVTPEHMPPTIFVTTHRKFAVRAFEARALDYLLRPFSDARFEAALQRARDHIRMQMADQLCRSARLLEAGGDITEGSKYPERIALRSGRRLVFLNVRDIGWIEGSGVYVCFHVGPKSLLYRATIGQIPKRLDPRKFVRVHRSAIVNTDHIRELLPGKNGGCTIILEDRAKLPLSRRYHHQLERALGQSF